MTFIEIADALEKLMEWSPANTGPDPAPAEPLTEKDDAIGMLAYELRSLARAQPQGEPIGTLPTWVLDFLNRRARVEEEMLRAAKNGCGATAQHLHDWAIRLGVPSQFASPPAQAVPEGFVLMPKQSTQEMYAAGQKILDYLLVGAECAERYDADTIFDAMLSAAPKPGGKP